MMNTAEHTMAAEAATARADGGGGGAGGSTQHAPQGAEIDKEAGANRLLCCTPIGGE